MSSLTRFTFPVGCLIIGMLLWGTSQVSAMPIHETHLTSATQSNTENASHVKTLVVFISSSTNNACGETIVLRSTGDVTILKCKAATLSIIPLAIATAMFRDVNKSTPLENLPQQHCLKSKSFGTTTVIAFAAQNSPDVSCSTDILGVTMYNDISTIRGALQVAPPIVQS